MDNTDYVGAILHVRMTRNDLPSLLRASVLEPPGEVAGNHMVHFQTMPAGSDKFSRQRRVSISALEELAAAWVSGTVDSIIFGSESLSEYCNEPLVLLSVSTTSSNCVSLDIHGPFGLLDQEKLVPYLRRIASQFECDYGQLVAGEGNYVMSLLSNIPIIDVETVFEATRTGRIDPVMSQFEAEMHFYHSRQQDMRRFIPRAAWGNILSPEHIAGLGGEERIRKESGCYLVERWGENLYLQTTESLDNVTAEDLIRLNRYFTPVRFPDAPEPVYLE